MEPNAEKDAATHREVAESMTGLWQAERERADRLEAMCDRLAERLVDLPERVIDGMVVPPGGPDDPFWRGAQWAYANVRKALRTSPPA